MPEDFNAQLASHDDLIRHLVALVTKMDTVIDALREDHRLIVQLLQRASDDDHRNGGSHA